MKALSIVSVVLFAAISFGGDGAMQDLGDWSDNTLFKTNSGYSDLLVRNVNMVKEASEKTSSVVKGWLKNNPKKNLTFLDVASGTDTPVVSRHLFEMLEKEQVSVKYTAIDINQKFAQVQAFQFPSNVVSQTLVVGDAYHVVSKEIVGKKFSVIYFGLNLHHLSLQELAKVLRDYKRLSNKSNLKFV